MADLPGAATGVTPPDAESNTIQVFLLSCDPFDPLDEEPAPETSMSHTTYPLDFPLLEKWFKLYDGADFVLLHNMTCPKYETDYRGPGPHVRSRPVHHAMNTVYDAVAAEDPLTVTQEDLSKYRRLYQQIEDRYLLENQDHDDTIYDGDSDIEDADYENHQPIVPPDAEERARRTAANPKMGRGDFFPGSTWDTADIELEAGAWRISEGAASGY
ncbi:hypothetical protein BKA65DRAFT_555028 [Rhexocercosporidium sp. MPI-PUGE-AT-0058]|nr:hypothetical protein BKA65DRAFT_555028 [Rhexocercosporidium sp. MPI-PUGE-AT-0058]